MLNLNMGYVSGAGVLEMGYLGEWTALPYLLTDHGVAHSNSVMASANFDTTGTVRIGIASDFDPAKAVFDWQTFSDQQLWLEDINTLETAVTIVSEVDTTTSATLDYYVVDSEVQGSFTATVDIRILPSIGVAILTLQGVAPTLSLGHMLSMAPVPLTVQGQTISQIATWSDNLSPNNLTMQGAVLDVFSLILISPPDRTLAIDFEINTLLIS